MLFKTVFLESQLKLRLHKQILYFSIIIFSTDYLRNIHFFNSLFTEHTFFSTHYLRNIHFLNSLFTKHTFFQLTIYETYIFSTHYLRNIHFLNSLFTKLTFSKKKDTKNDNAHVTHGVSYDGF